jgi:DNA repair protein RecN (Recombination protein N)
VLQELTIHNFAILDRLHVRWARGLNVITGETGAGKSILVDAVGALLGDRLGPEVVRSGADRALIEGIFVLEQDVPGGLQAVLDEYGLHLEDGALIVSREIAGAGGRGGARINGRSMPLSVLQQLGELLVDMHGQSQHMALLRSREQLDYVDRFGGSVPERMQVATLVKELRSTREARQTLVAAERETARLQDMLRHEVSEIERAELAEDEEEALLSVRKRLEHAERLREAAVRAFGVLRGDEDASGAVDLLADAAKNCADAAQFDPTVNAHVEALNTAIALADDVARTLRQYVDSIEADPTALERTTERLFLIGDLKRKYGETVQEVLHYAADARRRLDELAHREDQLAELQAAEQRLLVELGNAAAALSSARVRAAMELQACAERELVDLRFAGTRLLVSVAQADDASGVPVGGRVFAFDASGVDRVEFLLSANPGEEPRAIARVASGGELSRIALALKTILARAETRPTLIFDEIDVGVGGRTAPVVGEKLWRVAASGRQVLCVTHMPQVAAFADAHYVVSKDSGTTGVTSLDAGGRIDELAAMLGGAVTEATRQSARELLQRAGAIKSQQAAPTRSRRGAAS